MVTEPHGQGQRRRRHHGAHSQRGSMTSRSRAESVLHGFPEAPHAARSHNAGSEAEPIRLSRPMKSRLSRLFRSVLCNEFRKGHFQLPLDLILGHDAALRSESKIGLPPVLTHRVNLRRTRADQHVDCRPIHGPNGA